ncbi:Ulp1-like peptidase [Cucumis melo var. makuwa]|uniref:Ulp1-like peptidase n=1 Tax=Cucumis melo var. makuwa TaxID=1194695 RepID=A0A5D3CQP2_CUCMM|nr:Ulp1-like peptidase [Cucumis melo var. makuwa]
MASIMTSTSTDEPVYKINPSHYFYALVEDEGKDYISFLLGGVVCTFGRREFNIITGLWGPKEESIQLVGNSRLLEKFFKDKECIYSIIKSVIEMTPEEEQLKIASGELFENLRSSTIVQSKNGGSKLGREVVNDEGQLTSIKSDIDELKGMMSTILKHIGLQRKRVEGLVDQTLESEEVDNAKTEDVDIGGLVEDAKGG